MEDYESGSSLPMGLKRNKPMQHSGSSLCMDWCGGCNGMCERQRGSVMRGYADN